MKNNKFKIKLLNTFISKNKSQNILIMIFNRITHKANIKFKNNTKIIYFLIEREKDLNEG